MYIYGGRSKTDYVGITLRGCFLRFLGCRARFFSSSRNVKTFSRKVGARVPQVGVKDATATLPGTPPGLGFKRKPFFGECDKFAGVCLWILRKLRARPAQAIAQATPEILTTSLRGAVRASDFVFSDLRGGRPKSSDLMTLETSVVKDQSWRPGAAAAAATAFPVLKSRLAWNFLAPYFGCSASTFFRTFLEKS